MGGLSMLLNVAAPALIVNPVVPRIVRTACGGVDGPPPGEDGLPPPPQDAKEPATSAARTIRLSARLFIEHPSRPSRTPGSRKNPDSSRGGGGDQPPIG